MSYELCFSAQYSKADLSSAISNLANLIHNIPRDFVSSGSIFEKWRFLKKVRDAQKHNRLKIAPVTAVSNRFNMSVDSQKSQSVVSSIVNKTNLYYVLKDRSTNKAINMIGKGSNSVSLRLNNEKGYELIPYADYRNGWVANPILGSALEAVGGNIVFDTQALSNQGFAVSQGKSPISGFTRSHAVALWPNMSNAQVFAHGMPVSITVELDYLSKVPNLVFPRIASVERLGLSHLSYGSICSIEYDDYKNFVQGRLNAAINHFNEVLSNSNYDYTTQETTKQNSVTGDNDVIPTSGQDAWLWKDIPNG